jgi:hypothetical protein
MTEPHNDPQSNEFITDNATPAPPQSDATPADVIVTDDSTGQMQPPPGDNIPLEGSLANPEGKVSADDEDDEDDEF